MKLLSLFAAPLLVSASPLLAERQADRSVDTLFKGVGKIYFGASTEQQKFSDDGGKVGAIMQQNFGQATNEYLMKWDQTEAVRGQCTLDAAKQLVSWAQANGKSVRGHTLVWGEEDQLPAWVLAITDPTDMKKAIVDHINCVVGGFKGQIRAWDVVNEIFSDDFAGLKQTHFYNVLGEEYVSIAFNAARAADPAAKLYINDYGLDNVGWMKFQPGGIIDKVKAWKAQNIPIDGIGSQTHLAAANSAGVETALRTLAGVVDEVAITELDIEGRDPQDYIQAVVACYHVPTCVGITVWGVCSTDKTLFQDNCDPTDAYYAVADYLKSIQ